MRLNTARTIREEEGYREEVYQDSLGHLTVGYGHRVLPEDEITEGDLIPQERCERFFLEDLAHASRVAQRVCAECGGWTGDLEHVLTCMAYQLGESGLRSFHRMLAALRAGDYDRAADEALDSLWARQTPARARVRAEELRSMT